MKEFDNLFSGELKTQSSPEGGPDFVRLDAFSSDYYTCRYNLSKSTFISENPKTLPLASYLVPVSLYGRSKEDLTIVQRKFDRNQINFGYLIPALRMTVDGVAIADRFRDGAKLKFSVGLLSYTSITGWLDRRDSSELWISEVWEQTGIDYRLFLRKSSIAKLPMETFRMKKSVDLGNIRDVQTQLLCDLLQVDRKGGTSVDRTVCNRVRAASNEELREAYALVQTKEFFEIENVTKAIPERLKRLLAINMCFSYWQCNDILYSGRALNLKELKLPVSLNDQAMWNDCVEAGCRPKPRSVVLKELKQVRNRAKRHFKMHPEDFSRLYEKLVDERGGIVGKLSNEEIGSKIFILPARRQSNKAKDRDSKFSR